MERDLDFEKRYNYDPSTNYEDVLVEISDLLPMDKEAAVEGYAQARRNDFHLWQARLSEEIERAY